MLAPVVSPGRMRNLPQPTLTVDELTVRPWRLSDVPAVFDAYQDPQIQQWHVRTMTVDEARTWVESWPGRWSGETGADWAVTERDTLLGRVGLRTIELAGGMAEIAYWTVPAARGRQVAPRAVRAVSEWMFEQVGLHRLELNHSTGNPASCRVAEKSGYRYEGTRRQQLLHADGWHDTHLHRRLYDDAAPPVTPSAGAR